MKRPIPVLLITTVMHIFDGLIGAPQCGKFENATATFPIYPAATYMENLYRESQLPVSASTCSSAYITAYKAHLAELLE